MSAAGNDQPPPIILSLSRSQVKVAALDALQTNMFTELDFKLLRRTSWITRKIQKLFPLSYRKVHTRDFLQGIEDIKESQTWRHLAETHREVVVVNNLNDTKQEYMKFIQHQAKIMSKYNNFLLNINQEDIPMNRPIRLYIGNVEGQLNHQRAIQRAVRFRNSIQDAQDLPNLLEVLKYGFTTLITTKTVQLKLLISLTKEVEYSETAGHAEEILEKIIYVNDFSLDNVQEDGLDILEVVKAINDGYDQPEITKIKNDNFRNFRRLSKWERRRVYALKVCTHGSELFSSVSGVVIGGIGLRERDL